MARLLARWDRQPAGRFIIYHDPDLPLHMHEGQGVFIVLLGTVIDPVNMVADPSIIVRDLHASFSESEEMFFDRLDDLSGRFVILVESGSRAFVLQDATGTKTLYYDIGSDDMVLASHAPLIAELRGYSTSTASRKLIASSDYVSQVRYFPGLYTPFISVRMLTPNTLLDLSDMTVSRFFPRGPVEKAGISDGLVAEIAGLLMSQVSLLSRQCPLSVSLTAGIDSRVTMAAVAGSRTNASYFTYVQQPVHEREAAIAQELCTTMGVQHTVYRIDERSWGDGLDEYMETWRLNTAGMRADSQGHISKVLYEDRRDEYIHLKSVVSETGKAFYRSRAKGFLSGRISPEVLARQYNIDSHTRFVLEAFREYIDTVGFVKDSLFNYDFYDLFYWEHRSGAWQSLQIMDFDTAHETQVLYNNRRILEGMLRIPLEDRLNTNLHRRLIEYMWPDGLSVPFLSDTKPWHVKATKEVARKVKYRIEGLLDGARSR